MSDQAAAEIDDIDNSKYIKFYYYFLYLLN